MQCLEELEHESGLHKEIAPQLEQELDINSGHACNEMFFEGIDDAFGSVNPVIIWFDQEPVNML